MVEQRISEWSADYLMLIDILPVICWALLLRDKINGDEVCAGLLTCIKPLTLHAIQVQDSYRDNYM